MKISTHSTSSGLILSKVEVSNFKLKINLIIALISVSSIILATPNDVFARERFFQVQSVDTMKFSRDVARGKLKDPSFDKEITAQVKDIAGVGATHVAVGTPYDEEFLPFLKRWVKAVRSNGLKVWFRGNFSGWENWFDYPRISREEHTAKTKEFILKNPDLFEDGDIFTSCPECENGGPGDPRMKGDVEGFRRFIIAEYQTARDAFRTIEKRVTANYYSMNGDVALLTMDKETTKAIDGIVTIDHYVSSVERLIKDIKDYAQKSGGKVVLGEFGAPIPDIHGKMSEDEQARWIEAAISKMIRMPEVVGINYWTNTASSTQLWEPDHTPREAVATLTRYYNPINLTGSIRDKNDEALKEVTIKTKYKTYVVTNDKYAVPVLDGESVTFSKYGYVSVNTTVRARDAKDIQKDIVLAKAYSSAIYSFIMRIVDFIKSLLKGKL